TPGRSDEEGSESSGQDEGSEKTPEEGGDKQPSQKSEDPKRRSESAAEAEMLELVSFEEAPEDFSESPRSHKLTDEEVEALKAQATELEALKKKMAEEVAQKAAEQTAEDIKAMGEVSERTTEVPDDKKTATPEKHSTPQATEGKKPGKPEELL
ncbi:hypothetical protein ADUPG1_005007, partial [Aduncisulcus paluster]